MGHKDRIDKNQDEDASRCPKCGRGLEPEPFVVDGRTHIAYRCPRHGVEAVANDK